MGDEDIATPRLDALAAEGMMMRQAVAACPLCSPNRATLLTGKYPSGHGVLHNKLQLAASEVTIAELLGEAGYATGYIGKWHLDGQEEDKGDPGFIPPERRQGFDYFAGSNHGHYYQDTKYYLDEPELIHATGYEPEVFTELAGAFIADHAEQPFFLMLSLGPPHEPLADIPDAVWDSYRDKPISKRPNVELGDNPYQDDEIPSDIVTKTEQYYAACTHLDGCVGKLLDQLDALGLSDDTIVVFLSDHGDHLGSHGLGGKSSPYEEAIRVPLLIRYPRAIAPAESELMMSSVDIMPTLLGLLGLPIPASVQGQDRAAHLRGVPDEGPELVFFEHYQQVSWRAVRSKRYKYAEMANGKPAMFFDLVKDPYEEANLVISDNPKHAALREQLAEKLHDWYASVQT